jgi:hypothetical protein
MAHARHDRYTAIITEALRDPLHHELLHAHRLTYRQIDSAHFLFRRGTDVHLWYSVTPFTPVTEVIDFFEAAAARYSQSNPEFATSLYAARLRKDAFVCEKKVPEETATRR